MEFDPLEGLLDHEVPLESGHLAFFPAESQASIAPELMEQLLVSELILDIKNLVANPREGIRIMWTSCTNISHS